MIPSSKPAICENSPVPSHTEHESKGHIRLSGQGMEVQPSWDVASQTTRPSAEVTPGPASPSFGLGKGWHTVERKPGQEEPLGQMLKGNQVSREGRQGQADWLGTFFQQERRQPPSAGIFPVTQVSTASPSPMLSSQPQCLLPQGPTSSPGESRQHHRTVLPWFENRKLSALSLLNS